MLYFVTGILGGILMTEPSYPDPGPIQIFVIACYEIRCSSFEAQIKVKASLDISTFWACLV